MSASIEEQTTARGDLQPGAACSRSNRCTHPPATTPHRLPLTFTHHTHSATQWNPQKTQKKQLKTQQKNCRMSKHRTWTDTCQRNLFTKTGKTSSSIRPEDRKGRWRSFSSKGKREEKVKNFYWSQLLNFKRIFVWRAAEPKPFAEGEAGVGSEIASLWKRIEHYSKGAC